MSVFRVKKTLVRTVLVVGFAAGLSATLQGCFLAVAGAAGGGALVATDRRTLGAQTEDREMQVKALSQISQNLPDNAHVNVAVFNRRVLLTGEVAGDVVEAARGDHRAWLEQRQHDRQRTGDHAGQLVLVAHE